MSGFHKMTRKKSRLQTDAMFPSLRRRRMEALKVASAWSRLLQPLMQRRLDRHQLYMQHTLSTCLDSSAYVQIMAKLVSL